MAGACFLAGDAFLLGVFLAGDFAGDLALDGDFFVAAAFLAGEAFALLGVAAALPLAGDAGALAGETGLAGELVFVSWAAAAATAAGLAGDFGVFLGEAVGFLAGAAFFGEAAFLAGAAFFTPAAFLAGVAFFVGAFLAFDAVAAFATILRALVVWSLVVGGREREKV